MKKQYAKKDGYQVITDRIIELLEKGIVPWKKSWNGSGNGPQNLISKKHYRGINSCLLHCSGFESPFFLTYNQAKQKGGQVRKGAKGFPVVFWKFFDKMNDEGKKTGSIPMVRYSTVFNIDQCDGIETPTDYIKKEIDFNPIEKAESIVKGYIGKPEIRHGEGRAYYSPSTDFVMMPHKETFYSEREYYGTLFHELTHSTGHKTRLNREGIQGVSGFGSQVYSKEELVAEFGATYLCSECAITNEDLEKQSASYIHGWLSKLKSDKKILIQASGMAVKATHKILGTTPDYNEGEK